ncbi:uncharacterized protein TNCV_10591 [Trichonephila clavipes]|nr:uncharacterized protein TNCV_10591 [Trichonephila clavipes]
MSSGNFLSQFNLGVQGGIQVGSPNFGYNRVISRYFPDAWPSRSSDLNLYDFWLWGFLKYRVCRGRIRTLPDLKVSIVRHVAKIPRELLRAPIENVIMSFQRVIDINGAHIEHILELNKF